MVWQTGEVGLAVLCFELSAHSWTAIVGHKAVLRCTREYVVSHVDLELLVGGAYCSKQQSVCGHRQQATHTHA